MIRTLRFKKTRVPSVRLLGPERLESRSVLSGVPFGALANDTAEYLLGDVLVNVVFMESNGSLDQNRENWTTQLTSTVKAKIEEGMQWWKDTLANAFPNSQGPLNFTFDYTLADSPVSTPYEPITRPSDDFSLWTRDFFNQVGFNRTGDFSLDIKAFNHSQRVTADADWSFTIFVVNDTNDPDHQFHPSGSFDRSFAFSGGRFEVVLASRPASTFAHETGHIFWAKDEYLGGSSWTDRRGYYNSLNYNAADNSTQGFQQASSIMTSGALLDQAYASHTSPSSTLEMIGWKDSDGDGIFDVIDVPHSLTGVGFLDAASGNYRFVGHSAVRTLPNQNSDQASLKNDITINEIGRAEFRLNGGDWQTVATYDAHATDLDLTIPIPVGEHLIEIRTYDPKTRVGSDLFKARTNRPAAVAQPGINGFVWNDADLDGAFDSTERGLSGRQVRIIDANQQPVNLIQKLEPDDYNSGSNLGSVSPHVTLSAVGANAFSTVVTTRTASIASTGTRVFSNNNTQDTWSGLRQLKMTFPSPITTVSIDAVGNGPGLDYGRLEIYDSSDNLLGRYTSRALSSGQTETMTVSRPSGDIAYALAYGHAASAVVLDNLRFGPESSATTDSFGSFAIPNIPAGTYRVQLVPAVGLLNTSPATGERTVTLTSGQTASDVDFGQATGAPWQNSSNQYDVNRDGTISAIDVLLIINDINANGSRQLPSAGQLSAPPPPFFDVNADGFISPIDALLVIDAINNGAGGEGEGSGTDSHAPDDSADDRPLLAANRLRRRLPNVDHVFMDDRILAELLGPA